MPMRAFSRPSKLVFDPRNQRSKVKELKLSIIKEPYDLACVPLMVT